MNADETILATEVKDMPLSYLGEFARQLFERIREEVLGRPKLSAKERNWFEGEAQTFDDHFKKILQNKDKQQQEVALRAVASALCLTYYHAGGPQILREIKANHENERAKKAYTARKADDIQKIIERHARKLWNDKPSFKLNREGTASGIYEAVYTETRKLPKVPKQWAIKNPNDKAEKKRAIQRIGKRIKLIQQADDR